MDVGNLSVMFFFMKIDFFFLTMMVHHEIVYVVAKPWVVIKPIFMVPYEVKCIFWWGKCGESHGKETFYVVLID